MNFYTALSKYYDDIFPANENTIQFLMKSLNCKDRVLDIACGSGSYSIALAKRNVSCSALDSDPSMVSKANTKALEHGLNISFTCGDMMNLKNYYPQSSFGSAFCIGNSLVHLQSREDICHALKEIHDILKVHGKLVIQIINYYRILKHNIPSLPTINNETAGLEFIRTYTPNGDKISFNTILNTRDEGSMNSKIDLIPITYLELIDCLEECGFEICETYGNFKKDKFIPDESVPFIVECMKK